VRGVQNDTESYHTTYLGGAFFPWNPAGFVSSVIYSVTFGLLPGRFHWGLTVSHSCMHERCHRSEAYHSSRRERRYRSERTAAACMSSTTAQKVYHGSARERRHRSERTAAACTSGTTTQRRTTAAHVSGATAQHCVTTVRMSGATAQHHATTVRMSGATAQSVPRQRA
jgi:hypothetical protein